VGRALSSMSAALKTRQNGCVPLPSSAALHSFHEKSNHTAYVRELVNGATSARRS
jgi:hypothetical protein